MKWFSIIGVLAIAFLVARSCQVKWTEHQAYQDSANGNYEKASGEYNKIASLNEKSTGRVDWRTHASLARNYSSSGQNDKAIAEYTIAIDGVEGNPLLRVKEANRLKRMHDLRGYLYFQSNNYSSAIADFNAALKLAPNDRSSLEFRIQAYRAGGQIGLAEKDEQELRKRGYAPSQ